MVINLMIPRYIHTNNIVMRNPTQLEYIVIVIMIASTAIKLVTHVMAQIIISAYLVKAYFFTKILAWKSVLTAFMLYQRHGIANLIALWEHT